MISSKLAKTKKAKNNKNPKNQEKRKTMSILCRGLKFTPAPLPNKMELKNDVQQFSRKLRLLVFFYKEN